MPEMILRNGRKLGDTSQPYFVAEANSSHNGNMDTAKAMVKKASEIGCDCIKFQSWSPDTLYSKAFYRENPISGKIVKKFSLSLDQQKQLSEFCSECGIDFASTPYSKEEVDFLVNECNVPFIKVASMELNNYPFLSYIASRQVPIVLATGMGDWQEIEKAVKVIEENGNPPLCILHCVSVYPAKLEEMNLKNISALQTAFAAHPIGLSDHSVGSECAVAAVAMGAALIEKHFTLDNSKIGMDNQMATEPDAFHMMIEQCKIAYAAMGSSSRIVTEDEQEMRRKMRRSVITTRKMLAGEVIKIEDLTAKRPGTGLPPEMIEELIGRTVLHDLDCEALVSWKDIN